MSDEKTFGEYFRQLRIRQGKTLRQFCIDNSFDPGNISKLERGVLPPPTGADKLTEYAGALGVREGSDDWYSFFDLAALGAGRLPPALSDQDILNRLPMFCRTVRNEQISGEDLDRLISMIRRS